MKKLAFTTAIALALATAAYAQDHHGGGGRGPGPGIGGGGGSPGLSAQAPSGGPSNFGASRGPSAPNNMSGLNNRAPTNMNSYKQGGQNLDKDRFSNRDRDRFSDRDNGRRLYNRADRDHDFNRDRNLEGSRDFQRRGIVSGNFFEHGRHFRFRRFFHGDWVFLTAWDDCTAWAWVNIAPGTWAWRPVDVCVG
jgi:hypothetical protein